MVNSSVGYCRVSGDKQQLRLQIDALEAAGCSKIFSEKVSGATASRPELDACLAYLREGDTLVVYKLDRLGRSLKHLLAVMDDLRERGIGFQSLSDGIDTTTSTGRLMFSIMGSFAEFERSLIQERTNAGLKAARERGKLGGRPCVVTPDMARRIDALLEGGHSIDSIARVLGIGRATIYRSLKDKT